MVAIDPPTVRFLAPIYLPLVIVACAALDALVRAEHERPVHRRAVVLAVSFLVAGAVSSTLNVVKSDLADGPGGYGSTQWRQSELVSLSNAQPVGWTESYVEIYSNDPWAAYLLNDLVALLSASETKRLSDEPGLPRQAMCPDASERLLVWYQTAEDRTYLYSLAEIEQVCVLEPVLIASDGIAARLLPR